ncbi:WYL domain-containing protein [Hyunsoonleella flava]|uniref:WYL domain-containing protein n=1 Tax=Hyunsoonleella flava TaxID=2527939 RepID=A0A4Q9FJ98_9FLAO|nr:WYL domain-containing protein [Hyunsoonleella flava]TBN06695.1 WYL domain-containing protein [Hyunsoonleella flava]
MRELPKNIQLRYRVIDRLLRDYDTVKTSFIINKVYERHDISVGETTIQRDIRNMITDYHAPIEYDTSKKAYYYPENIDEIFPIIELLDEEINALLFYFKTITQYRDYPIFKEISMTTKKVIDSSNISLKMKELFEQNTLLETEKHPLIPGLGNITELLDCIANHNVIEVNYRRHNKESKKHFIKPLLLKEDKLLWYLIGINIKYDSLITFGLDRIISFKRTGEVFEKIDFNSQEYFKYSFGVTVTDEVPIEVIISFKSKQGHYLKTLPIHHTQEIVEENKEFLIIKVIVKPSYEFYSKIFSYGSDARIISPKSVIAKVVDALKNAQAQYKIT